MTGEIRWCCVRCGANGDAGGREDLAIALQEFHEANACPATAETPAGFAARLVRHENMRRVHGDDEFPEYTKHYRPPQWRLSPKPEDLPRLGVWLVASTVQGKDVGHGDEYPHICGTTVPGKQTESGMPYRYTRDDCIACANAGHVWRRHQ